MKNISKARQGASPVGAKYYYALAAVLLVTLIAYLPVFQNSLLAWDDNAYIKENSLLHPFNLIDIFTKNVLGNYHPVTILAFAAEYRFFGLDATGYHAVNLCIHLLNVILVYYVVFLLADKPGIALVASLLFGIHPLHVESVAWVAELKDLLYTFFFLISFIFYLKYLNNLKTKFYVLSLSFFVVSLLSKAMAASLPVVLLLTDYFKGRKLNANAILEKIPFFAFSLLLGVTAIIAQHASGSMADIHAFSFPQHIAFAAYSFITYLWKLLLPVNLSAFYPYPVNYGDAIPILFYSYIIIVLAFIAGIIYSIRSSKKLFFGIGFFSITIFLVLQILPVGSAIMADRYSYLPSIGIFYLAGEGILFLWDKKIKWLPVILLGTSSVFFTVKTYERCGTWKNDLSLWNDVIGKYETVSFAYYNRGNYYLRENKNAEALADFNKAIELDPGYADAFNSRGLVYRNQKRYDDAMEEFNRATALNPAFAEGYYNRGNEFMYEGRNEEAVEEFSKAIELNANYADAYNNRGLVFKNEGKFDEAVQDFSMALNLKPGNAKFFYNRANAYFSKENYTMAYSDFNSAIRLDPSFAEAYNGRGLLLTNEGKYQEAVSDFNKSIKLNPGYGEVYYNLGNVFYTEKNYEEAIKYYTKALSINPNFIEAYYTRGISEYYLGNPDAALIDLRIAAGLGYRPAVDALERIKG